MENEKESTVPNEKESEFAETVLGQVMLMINIALTNKSFVESQTLSWATIEQILMPRLIAWVAKMHKINLSEDVYKSNMKNVNLTYFTLSHDHELLKLLEDARKKRNEVTHKIIELRNISSMEKLAKESTKMNILLQEEIMKRFNGEIPIPSLNLYRNGWNDCRSEILKK